MSVTDTAIMLPFVTIIAVSNVRKLSNSRRGIELDYKTTSHKTIDNVLSYVEMTIGSYVMVNLPGLVMTRCINVKETISSEKFRNVIFQILKYYIIIYI